MLKRTITAVCAVALFIPICLFSDTVIFPLAMTLLSEIAVYEMLHCVGMKRLSVVIPSYLLGLLPLIPRFAGENAVPVLFGCCVVYLIAVLAADVFSRGTLDFADSAAAFLCVFYVTVSFASIVLLRGVGRYFYLLTFIGPWVSDTFAYLTGRAVGKHKLIPEVSPKKTVEGSIGGIVFAALGFVGFAALVHAVFDPSLSPNFVVLAVSGAVVSVISQIGDLSASVIKRRYGVKDYGWLFPGHGGVMDRFDSVLLTAPVLFLLSRIPAFSGLIL